MAVKSSGPLSFSEIQAELGGSNPISLSEYYKNGSIINNDIHDPNGIPNSGNPITVNDFYSCSRRQFAQWSGGNQSDPNGTASGNFKTHVFTNSGSFNRSVAPIGTNRDELHYIVIGGGGGGGTVTGGGGGAGDFMSGHIHTGNRTSYYMRIGGGGGPANYSGPGVRAPTGQTNRGTRSAIHKNSSANSSRFVTGIGGGGGMNYTFHNSSSADSFFANGGSGGGGSGIVDGQRGFKKGGGSGHDGGNGAERESTLCGGGGGGAGGAGMAGVGTANSNGSFNNPGTNASRGGIGIDISGFPGANGYRAGGGTGGGLRSNATRTPFSGGGGSGGPGPGIASTPGGNGGASKGAGGGGGGYNGNGVGGLGGNGGKGIIAVKYQYKS